MKKNDGIISMEACIVLPIFFFLMLFLYGFILMFWVQNEMTHALIQATEKLAVEPYHLDSVWNSAYAGDEMWMTLEEDTFSVFNKAYQAPSIHNAYGLGNWVEGAVMEELLESQIEYYVGEYFETASWNYEAVKAAEEFNVTNIYYDVALEDLDGNGRADKVIITMHYTYEFLFDFQGTVKKNVAIHASARLLRAE
jgi:hypothetical protein